jgi:hypothetical protein
MRVTHARIIRRAVDCDVIAVYINGRRAGELSVVSGGGETLRRYLFGRRLRDEPPEEPDA